MTPPPIAFQHTAARRRLGPHLSGSTSIQVFQHTAARRRLDCRAIGLFQQFGFNTQPPEGGWVRAVWNALRCSFNTQPPEGGWPAIYLVNARGRVSTHSRPKAAGGGLAYIKLSNKVSTHSRPKAAGLRCQVHQATKDCFNTQPPEGGWAPVSSASYNPNRVSTHSRPKAAGASLKSLAPSGFAAPISLSSQKSRNASITQPFPLHLHSQYPDC